MPRGPHPDPRHGPLHGPLQPRERQTLGAYAGYLRERFGPRLRLLRVFGARLRGDEADLEVVAVVDALSLGERQEIWECTGALLQRFGTVVRGMAMSTAAWQGLAAREHRIVQEIRRDGVDL